MAEENNQPMKMIIGVMACREIMSIENKAQISSNVNENMAEKYKYQRKYNGNVIIKHQ